MRVLEIGALVAIGACLLAGGAAGCGDDSAAQDFEGCGSDNDCKGDRICEQGMCVDPEQAGSAGDGDGDASGGDGDGDASGGDGDGEPGSAGDGSAASGSGDPVDRGEVLDDPDLEEACIRDCEARHEASCEMSIGSLDQCMGQCLIIDEQNYGACHDEQRRRYDCLAAGGYTCVQGYPQPQSTCVNEQLELSTCTQESPCRRFCAAVAGSECEPEGDDCFATCRQREQEFEDVVCSFGYTSLVSCWALSPVCDGGRLSIADCQLEATQIADCIGLRTGECEGFCWAAEALGCGSADCVSTCMPKLDDAACGWEYRRLLECSWDARVALHLECVDGAPAFTAECATEQQEYDDCVASSSGQ